MSTDSKYRFSGDVRSHRLLSDLVPLSTPLSMLVDPTNACNFRCIFCPTGHPGLIRDSGRGTGLMNLELFEKVVGDIGEFGSPLERLHLHKDGEPLIHKELARMIRLAKLRGIASSVETTTNGALLTRDRAVELLESGLDRLRISVEHVTAEGYRRLTGTSTTYGTLLGNTRVLYEEKLRRGSAMTIHVKLLDTGLSPNERDAFLSDFSGCCDEIHIDALMGWSASRVYDFTLATEPTVAMSGNPLRNPTVCPQPFYTMAVNYNGLVSVCCVDWGFKTIIGDARTTSLKEIWTGAAMRRFRLMHLEGNRTTHSACGHCQYLRGMPATSDLDAHRERLLATCAEDE